MNYDIPEIDKSDDFYIFETDDFYFKINCGYADFDGNYIETGLKIEWIMEK
jgi:hypothetical protein